MDRSAYKLIINPRRQQDGHFYKIFCNILVPLKINLMGWKVLQDRISSKSYWAKKKVSNNRLRPAVLYSERSRKFRPTCALECSCYNGLWRVCCRYLVYISTLLINNSSEFGQFFLLSLDFS